MQTQFFFVTCAAASGQRELVRRVAKWHKLHDSWHSEDIAARNHKDDCIVSTAGSSYMFAITYRCIFKNDAPEES